MRIEFWSSTECNAFMSGLVRELRAAGHDAVHRFQVPNADYRDARSWTARVWLRLRMYLLYPMQVLVSFTTQRSRCVSVISTNTFFAPFLASLVASRRRRLVHLIYDLYPDVLVQGGVIRAGGLVDRATGAVTKWTFHRCAANVFLGRELLRHAESRYGTIPNAVVIPVGADATLFRELRIAALEADPRLIGDRVASHEAPSDAEVTILYCGHMGRMHDYSTLATVLARQRETAGGDADYRELGESDSTNSLDSLSSSACTEPDQAQTSIPGAPLHFLLHSSGYGYTAFKALLGVASNVNSLRLNDRVRVTFAGSLPDGEWAAVMARADVALVTMAPGAEAVVMPSKAYSAMVAGQAILAICPRRSDLADLVEANNCGWVVEPGDASGLEGVFQIIRRQPYEVLRKRKQSSSNGRLQFDSRELVQKWLVLL